MINNLFKDNRITKIKKIKENILKNLPGIG